jgi:hypothetical protein
VEFKLRKDAGKGPKESEVVPFDAVVDRCISALETA